MKVTLTRTDRFERLETGMVEETYVFQGRGFPLWLAGKAVKSGEAHLKLVLEPEGALSQVVLELLEVPLSQLIEIRKQFQVPLSGSQLVKAQKSDLAFVLRPEEAQGVVAPLLRTQPELPALLGVCNPQGEAVLLHLDHYELADVALPGV